MNVVNLAEKFRQFDDHWSPRIVGEVNNFHVKVAKLQGEFVWHHHEVEDEMFMVIKGRLLIKLRDRDVWIEEGEFFIVPHGVEHCPVAPEEVHIVLFEPGGTVNTGNVTDDHTKTDLERI